MRCVVLMGTHVSYHTIPHLHWYTLKYKLFLHLCSQVRVSAPHGYLSAPHLRPRVLAVMLPEPRLPGLPGTRKKVGPRRPDPVSPDLSRAVMNPLGRSRPHALHSRSLRVQREAFDSHRQLSDGTKSLHSPLFFPLSARTACLCSSPILIVLPHQPDPSHSCPVVRKAQQDPLAKKRGLQSSWQGQQRGEDRR